MPAERSALSRLLWLPVGLTLLTGCVSVNVDTAPIAAMLPGLTSQLAGSLPPGTTTGAAVPGSTDLAACPNGATPAAGMMYGTSEMGSYVDAALPASFAAYQDEQAVTDRITLFAQDTSSEGTETWADFNCLFSDAVVIWSTRQQPASGCAAGIAPAAGTVLGTAAMGDYVGLTLPAGFSVYENEEEVTNRISDFAADTSDQGSATWIEFQCDYGEAVSVWRAKP